MAKCEICGENFMTITGRILLDGEICSKCAKKCEKIAKENGISWLSNKNTLEDIKRVVENPDIAKEILKDRNSKIEDKACIFCGEKCGKLDYVTYDNRYVCVLCGYKAELLPEMLSADNPNVKTVIAMHDTEYLKEKLSDVQVIIEEPLKNSTQTTKFVTASKKNGTINLQGKTYALSAITNVVCKPAKFMSKPQYTISCIDAKKKGHDYTYEKKTDAEIYEIDKKMQVLLNADSPEVQRNSATNYEELIELKKLLDVGIITQEEFDKKKAEILKM